MTGSALVKALAVALAASVACNVAGGWAVLKANQKIGAAKEQIASANATIKALKGQIEDYAKAADRDFTALQTACLAGRDAALKAGRTIGRITNAPAPAAGRITNAPAATAGPPRHVVVGADELRDIYGQTRAD